MSSKFIVTIALTIVLKRCFHEKLKTPHIDRLGSEGIIFTQHYSGNTVCSPSRAVLIAGQHPSNVHCRGNVGVENIIAWNSGSQSFTKISAAFLKVFVRDDHSLIFLCF